MKTTFTCVPVNEVIALFSYVYFADHVIYSYDLHT